ncbi:MAG TPA: hypothetical protein VIM42_09250 [Clostridium sp.]
MSEYIYKDPRDRGLIKFKISKKQHNSIFKHRKITWRDKYEYYYDDKEIIMHRFVKMPLIFLAVLLFPVIVLMTGILNIKEAFTDVKKSLNQKKYGGFSSDQLWYNTEPYKAMMKIINKM